MDERLWSLLERTGFSYLAELKGHFLTPWHVACSVDNVDDTVLLVRQLKSGLLEQKRKERLSWSGSG